MSEFIFSKMSSFGLAEELIKRMSAAAKGLIVDWELKKDGNLYRDAKATIDLFKSGKDDERARKELIDLLGQLRRMQQRHLFDRLRDPQPEHFVFGPDKKRTDEIHFDFRCCTIKGWLKWLLDHPEMGGEGDLMRMKAVEAASVFTLAMWQQTAVKTPGDIDIPAAAAKYNEAYQGLGDVEDALIARAENRMRKAREAAEAKKCQDAENARLAREAEEKRKQAEREALAAAALAKKQEERKKLDFDSIFA